MLTHFYIKRVEASNIINRNIKLYERFTLQSSNGAEKAMISYFYFFLDKL